MKKKLILVAFIIFLIVPLIIALLKQKSSLEYYNWQQTNIDKSFKYNLSRAGSGIGSISVTGYTADNCQTISLIDSSAQLFGFTTYSKKNNGLDVSLADLSLYMKNDKNEKIIIQESKALYDAFLLLSINPEDKPK